MLIFYIKHNFLESFFFDAEESPYIIVRADNYFFGPLSKNLENIIEKS